MLTLKTPLTSLLGNAQLLHRRALREGGLSERDRRTVEVIVSQASRLNQMVAMLLDIARIEQGQLQLERAPFDLAALVGRVVAEIQPSLQQHTVIYNAPDTPLLVDGDELRLEQVVQNLIGNAIKYSPAGGEVRVQLANYDTTACMTVRDQGIGIPADALPQLFQRFYRAANAEAQHIRGMGVGLYVIKEIVLLHGGTIAVDSAERQGSTFTVNLPWSKVKGKSQKVKS